MCFGKHLLLSSFTADFLTHEKQKCCYFKFSSIMQYNKIAKAQLWIYLKPVQKRTTVFVQTFRLPRYLNDNLRSTGSRPLKLEMNPGPGIWKSIDVKNALQNWLKQLESNIGIEIKATDENGRDIPVGHRGSNEDGLVGDKKNIYFSEYKFLHRHRWIKHKKRSHRVLCR